MRHTFLLMTVVLFAGYKDGQSQSSVTIDSILTKVDHYRGLTCDYSAETGIQNLKNGRIDASNNLKLWVHWEENSRKVLLRYLSPSNERDNLVLSYEEKMWIMTRSTSRPIPVSMSQRLLGGASIGDVANIEWRGNYEGTVERKDSLMVLNLSAIKKNALYEKITLTIRSKDCRPISADFLSKSGKSLKEAQFESFERVSNQEVVTKMTINDRLNAGLSTVVSFGAYKKEVLPSGYFDKNNLVNIRFGQ
jgi:hypothetical protein